MPRLPEAGVRALPREPEVPPDTEAEEREPGVLCTGAEVPPGTEAVPEAEALPVPEARPVREREPGA